MNADPAARFPEQMDDCLGGAPPPAALGVAVSGGGDSMALMALLAGWAAGRGVTLAAVTVDHGLRPEASEEAALAARQAARFGLAHDTLKWGGWDGAGNLQDAARRARAGLIADWATARGIAAVALGHTLDDQAETVLLRLARGSGVDGLAGMAPRRRADGVTWLRPMLALGRAELRDWLAAEGIPWADDPSNLDPRFDRVKARRALTALAPLGIGAGGLAATARHMARARRALEEAVRDAARALARATPTGDVEIARDGLARLPAEIRLRLMAHALRFVASAPYRPRLDALERLTDAALAGRGGTLHGCRVEAGGPALAVIREAAALRDTTAQPGALWDGRWRVTGPAGAPAGLRVAALGESGLAACPDWRETGAHRASLLASPAVWAGERLVAAPLAALGGGWRAVLETGGRSFADRAITD